MAVDEDEVPPEAEHDERHRQRHPDRVCSHRVDGVRDDRRRRDHSHQPVHEPQRIPLEYRPAGRFLGADQDELAAALRESEEEREQRRADEQPQ